jgi:uncharacterized protein YbaR (Trm112 family)
MIDPELLSILCCPATRQALREADAALVESVNRRIVAGELSNAGGTRVSDALEGGLVRADDRLLYPVRQGIPVLLIEEGIPL